ncbi:hypothetical protein JCM5296_000652 [Sporobolomyces johnsonii]
MEQDPSTSPPAVAAPSKPVSPVRRLASRFRPSFRLTLFGRSLFLLIGEILANVVIWAAAIATLAPDPVRRGVLSLCVVAWTLGLRHGLDMDHIVAIDNVTRNLVSMGKLPVTVGLFFSLGHSTIVISMTIAIIIATSAIDKLPDISSVGGVIGVSVSASFLFILAVINSVVLWQSLRLAKRRRQLKQAMRVEQADIVPVADSTPDPTMSKKLDDEEADQPQTEELVPGLPATTCLARIGRPMFRLIDRSWKMYPVGVLFGLGFDTASEISLLGISALARSGSSQIPIAQIILLPLLFTAGMTAVDSLDSMFMLNAYTWPARAHQLEAKEGDGEGAKWWKRLRVFERGEERVDEAEGAERARNLPVPDQDKLLSMSVVLTVISIVVALLISITEFMGLALEKCASCADAADNDPGLPGRWWRFWSAVNDNSGYLGAGVVGIFVLVFTGWGVQHYWRRTQKRRRRRAEGPVEVEEKT